VLGYSALLTHLDGQFLNSTMAKCYRLFQRQHTKATTQMDPFIPN
jgi:hypothetical protein